MIINIRVMKGSVIKVNIKMQQDPPIDATLHLRVIISAVILSKRNIVLCF